MEIEGCDLFQQCEKNLFGEEEFLCVKIWELKYDNLSVKHDFDGWETETTKYHGI